MTLGDLDQLRRSRNCDGDKPRPLSLPFAPTLQQCPWSAIPAEAFWWWERWREWKYFGMLPYGPPHYGSTVGDQPLFVMEAFQIMESVADALKDADSRAAVSRLASMLGGPK